VRRLPWALFALSVAFAGIMLLTVFPARTYLAQRRDVAAAERRLEVLSKENAQLAQRVEQLHTDEEIERIARDQYNLVLPGEEAYAILPAPRPDPPPRPVVPAPPKEEGGFWSRIWARVSFWS
jgi:cell division protein FtsB